MGTIRPLWLPLSRFLVVHGHHSSHMVTAMTFLDGPWAPFVLYGYRSHNFGWSMGTIRPLWLPLSQFGVVHGHHSSCMVTALAFFGGPWAPFVPYGYRYDVFRRSMGTIRPIWLPLLCFLVVHGHHSSHMVTAMTFLDGPWAPFVLYGYRSHNFGWSMGTIRPLWLPLSRFSAVHGHHSSPMVTALVFFGGPWAPFVPYGYRSCVFWRSMGTIRPLWLPLSRFWVVHGHHSSSMVTALAI